MNKDKLTFLDCTFRDRGYYFDWDSHQSIVKKYLKSIVQAKEEIFEIGFRFMHQSKFLCPFA